MLSPNEFDKVTGEYTGPIVGSSGPCIGMKDRNAFTYKGSYQEWFDGLSEEGKLSSLENEKLLNQRDDYDLQRM